MINQFKKSDIKWSVIALMCSLLGALPNLCHAQLYNEVLTVNPNSAAQGARDVTIVVTLDTDAPLAPPPSDLPTSVTVGSLQGSSIAHPSQFTISARFNIPVSTPTGSLDVAVTFSVPQNTLTFTKTAGFTVTAQAPSPTPTSTECGYGAMNLQQAISDQAQKTTIAFDGFGLITGNLEAQSFFPPGKLADYWGFQYLRDNDPDNMGHNTSFLTRVACNMIYILNDTQLNALKTLASNQIDQINTYGYMRYSLMKAFRRLLDGDIPSSSAGLDRIAVMNYSAQLYQVDGQICYDRAVVFSNIFRTFSTEQTEYLDAMAGVGWNSWPDVNMDDVRDRLAGLSHDASVAVMTYAGDMFSWYAGCIEADIYFCPERHGTYYGGFYIKDAPAIGHEGYSINEQLTAIVGSALCDSAQGYVTPEQAALVSSLTDMQRNNLYAGASNMVLARTAISIALRSLITETPPTPEFLAQVQAEVLEKSGLYGALDGENNYNYATVFAQLYTTLTTEQLNSLQELRSSVLSGEYSDGTPFDFTVCTTYYLFSAVITDLSTLDPYVNNTDFLFLPVLPPTPVPAMNGVGAIALLLLFSGCLCFNRKRCSASHRHRTSF